MDDICHQSLIQRVLQERLNEVLVLLNSYSEPPSHLECAMKASQTMEGILETIMVQNRRKLERDPQMLVDSVFFVDLILITIHAQTSRDLRFLDCANYFFEVLTVHSMESGEVRQKFLDWLHEYRKALTSAMEVIA